jgi:thiamine-monophosphate kinase
MAEASGLGLDLDLDAFPLSGEYVALLGDSRPARIDAAIAGDDYELLFAAPEESTESIAEIAEATGLPLTGIGRFREGSEIRLFDRGQEVAMPDRTGWEHGRD